MSTLNSLCSLGFLPLLALTAAAQTETTNWDSVRALIRTSEIRIIANQPKPIVGRLESTTDISLTLNPGSQLVGRADIASVSVKKNGHRLRNTFIGLGIGLGAGLAIGLATVSRCQGELCGIAAAAGVGVIGGLGMISGTVVGVVWPTGGWREVYRR
jgi:hypothetical protein